MVISSTVNSAVKKNSFSPIGRSSKQAALRDDQNPLMRDLANKIETLWQNHLDLSPYPIPEDLGYVEGTLQGEKIIIENHCYQSPEFRKLHLELARVSDRLHILHCVMFPRVTYDLPIFGADLVGQRQGVSAAIADLSPVRGNGTLPSPYHGALTCLPTPVFLKPRVLPEWGDIFSDFCLFVAPQNTLEETQFLQHVEAMLILHCQRAKVTRPAQSRQFVMELQQGHRYYCEKQRQNDKTRRVLEMSFGQAWAERYMQTMLFDTAA